MGQIPVTKYAHWCMPALACAVIAAIFLLPYWMIALFLLATCSALALLNLEWFLLVLLVLRPLFDLAVQQSAFSVGQTVTMYREQANLAAGATMLLIFVCLPYVARRWQTIWTPQFSRVFAVYLAIAFVSIFVSAAKMVSMTHFFRLLSILLLFLTLVDIIRTRKQFLRFSVAIMASSLIPIAMALFQVVTDTGNHETPSLNRVYGSFVHPNSLAYYLLAILLLSLGLWSQRMMRLSRALFAIFLGAALTALIFTYTRGAWFAFGCALIAYCLLMRKRALLLGFALIGVVLMPMLSQRVGTLLAGNEHENSALSRWLIWQQRIPLVLAHPVLGYGIGSTTEVSEAYTADTYVNHNDYLRVLLETGSVGLMAFLLLFVLFARDARRLWRAAHRSESRGMTAALVGAAILLPIGSIVENLLTQLVFQWYFWSVAAMAYAAVRLNTPSNTLNPRTRRAFLG